MAQDNAVDDGQFRRILTRNLALPLVMGVVSIGVFGLLLMYLLNTVGWVDQTHRAIAASHRLAAQAAVQESSLRGFLIAGEEVFLQPYTLGHANINALIDATAAQVADNPEQVDRLHAVRSLMKRWDEFAQQAIAMRRRGEDVQGFVRTQTGKQLLDEIRETLGKFEDAESELLELRTGAAQQAGVVGALAYVGLLLIVSVGLALVGRRDITKLASDYAAAREGFQVSMKESEERAWLRGAQLDLAQRVTGDLSPQDMGAAILHFLSGRIGMVVGAAYARADNGWLQRVASRGVVDDDRPTREDEFGLVGQVWRDGRMLELQGLADGFLRVATGLGETAPTVVVLLPALHEGRVNGVFELGLMAPPDARAKALLEALQEALGPLLAAADYRSRLHVALDEQRELNEELQVQQEELRTANEELGEQSRVLSESQTSLEHQRAELEQTNLQLAEQAETLARRNDDLHRAQADLKRQAQELQRASRYKSEFLANMSHELRTPLNSSLILAKLLAENRGGNLTEEQLKFATTIHSAGQDLLNLINDILDLAKVESGKLDIAAQPIALQAMVDALGRLFDPMAKERRLRFRAEIASDAPSTIVSDRQRLEQILKNLLSNALKFTEEGEVTLRVEAAPGERVNFIVQDTGIGIASEQQDKVFEAFHQGDGALNRRYGGTGLGLSISRELSALLGGSIQLRSTPGQGSTFTLTLPAVLKHEGRVDAPHGEPMPPFSAAQGASGAPSALAGVPIGSAGVSERAALVPPPAANTAPAAPVFDDDRPDLESPRVPGARWALVIEDDHDFAAILYALAHEMNYRCMVASSAQEGLELAARHQPEAILLDVRLPDDSGLAVLQRLKGDPRTRHIPVHVISSEDFGDIALPMGAVGMAIKPTTREELVEIFERLAQSGTERVRRLLLVEDDERQRESIVHLIGDDDLEVVAVDSGEAALAALQQGPFDCMVTDLKLPDMDGAELLARMAARHGEPQPPVIVYTGRQLSREEEAELNRYSRSIIIKGARSPERLLDEVTLFLHRVEARLPEERQAMLRTARNREQVFEGRKVLLVDDDMRNVFALTAALEMRGLTVEVARNGVEAIDKANAQPDIDIVLMDVMMPVMDGLEATRRLRADPRFRRLPIIAVTAKAMRDDQEQCRRAGANDYLAKPIDMERLVSLLRVWLPGLRGN